MRVSLSHNYKKQRIRRLIPSADETNERIYSGYLNTYGVLAAACTIKVMEQSTHHFFTLIRSTQQQNQDRSGLGWMDGNDTIGIGWRGFCFSKQSPLLSFFACRGSIITGRGGWMDEWGDIGGNKKVLRLGGWAVW